MYAYCMNDPVNSIDPDGQIVASILITRFVQAAIGGVSGAFAGSITGIATGGEHKLVASIVGGFVGGVTGTIAGLGFGGTTGGAIGGTLGGAAAGIVTKVLSDPHASTKDMLLAMPKGAGIGLVTGGIAGKLGAVVQTFGATAIIADLYTTVITTPIACVLGVFSHLFMGHDTEGTITSTIPDDWQYDPSWLFYWNPDNPQEIDRNSSVTIQKRT